MSELPAGVPRAEPARPRPSAAGLVVRRGPAGEWRMLQVLRARGTRFMPGHLAFPGGTVDPADRPGEDGAFERCVSREVEEETGLSIPAARWQDAGRRVTPPLFSMRFDNRFYVVGAPEGWEPPAAPPSPAEVASIAFHDPREVLAEWAAGRARLPPPSLPLLRALVEAGGRDMSGLAAALTETNDLEERAPRIEFLPDVWMVPLATATLPPATHTNVWLPGGERFAIIDHGATDEAEHGRLRAVIERRRAAGARPAAVLLTHGHQDHVGYAARLAAELDVPLCAHRDVFDSVSGLGAIADVRTEPLEDGDVIDLGGLTLQALLTPGHAPGHLAFLVPERRAVVAGDLVSGISTILIDPQTGDMGQYLDSLRRVERLGCRLLLPGHGPPLPGKALAKLLEHRLEREARALAELSRAPTGLPAIARGAYADVPEMPAALTERQALSHLLLLERQGRAVRDDPGGRSWRLGDPGAAE